MAGGAGVAVAGLLVAFAVGIALRWAAADDLEPLVAEIGIWDGTALTWLAMSRVTLHVQPSPSELLADIQLDGAATVPVVGWLLLAAALLAALTRRLVGPSPPSAPQAAATAAAVAAGYGAVLWAFAGVYEASLGGFVVSAAAWSAAVWGAAIGVAGAGTGALRAWSAHAGAGRARARLALRAARRAAIVAAGPALVVALAGAGVLARRVDVVEYADRPVGEAIVAGLFALAAVPDLMVGVLVAGLGATATVGSETLSLASYPPYGLALLVPTAAAIVAGARTPPEADASAGAAAWAGAGVWVWGVVAAGLAVQFSMRGEIGVGGTLREGEFRVEFSLLRLFLLGGLWTAAAGVVPRRAAAPGSGRTCAGCGASAPADAAFCHLCGRELGL